MVCDMGRADALGLMHRTKVRRTGRRKGRRRNGTGRRERNTGTGGTELDEGRTEQEKENEEKGTK